MTYEETELRRDCEAIQIPQGSTVTLPAGTPVVITQALGDSYTVQAPTMGGLFRISDRDAAAIGKQSRGLPPGAAETAATAAEVTEEAVREALKNVYDPEIPVNIVDLGLVYDLRVERQPSGKSRVLMAMTLTATGCGMGPAIAADARQRIEMLPGVEEADVQVVWDPPWTPHMISPEGRAILGMD